MLGTERLSDILRDKTRFTKTVNNGWGGSNFAILETKPSEKLRIKILINGKNRGWYGRFNTFYWTLEVDGEEIAREDCGDLFKTDFDAFLQQEFRKYSCIEDLINRKSKTGEVELIERTTVKEVEEEASEQSETVFLPIASTSSSTTSSTLSSTISQQMQIPTTSPSLVLEQPETALPFRELSPEEIQEYFSGESEQQAPIIAEQQPTGIFNWVASWFGNSESSYKQAIAPFLEEKSKELKARVDEFAILFKAKVSGRTLTKSEEKQYADFKAELLGLAGQSNDSNDIFAQMSREELLLYTAELKRCGIELIEETMEKETSTRKKSKQTAAPSTSTFSPASTFLSFLLMTAGMPTATAGFMAAGMPDASAVGNSSALALYRPSQFPAFTPQYSSDAIVRDSSSFLFGSTTYQQPLKRYYLRGENGLEQLLRPNHLSTSAVQQYKAPSRTIAQNIMPRIVDTHEAPTSTALVAYNAFPQVLSQDYRSGLAVHAILPPYLSEHYNPHSFELAQSPKTSTSTALTVYKAPHQSRQITPLYLPCIVLSQDRDFIRFNMLTYEVDLNGLTIFSGIREQHEQTDSLALVPHSRITYGDSTGSLIPFPPPRSSSFVFNKASTSGVSIELLDDDGHVILPTSSSILRYPQLLSEDDIREKQRTTKSLLPPPNHEPVRVRDEKPVKVHDEENLYPLEQEGDKQPEAVVGLDERLEAVADLNEQPKAVADLGEQQEEDELFPLMQQPLPEHNIEEIVLDELPIIPQNAALEQLHKDNEPEINQALINTSDAALAELHEDGGQETNQTLAIDPKAESNPINSTALAIEGTANIESDAGGPSTAPGTSSAPITPSVLPHSSTSGSRILTPPPVSTSKTGTGSASSSAHEFYEESTSPSTAYTTAHHKYKSGTADIFLKDEFNAIARDIIAKSKIQEEKRKREIRKQSESLFGRAELYRETRRGGSDINYFNRLEDSTQRFLVLAQTAENGLTTNQVNPEEAKRMALGKSAKTEEEAKAHLSCTPDEIRYPNGKENIQNPFKCSASLNADGTTIIKLEILDPQMYKME